MQSSLNRHFTQISYERLSDNVILRRQPKNLKCVSTRTYEILRGVYPEPVEGLRMTKASISGVVGQPLRGDFEAGIKVEAIAQSMIIIYLCDLCPNPLSTIAVLRGLRVLRG